MSVSHSRGKIARWFPDDCTDFFFPPPHTLRPSADFSESHSLKLRETTVTKQLQFHLDWLQSPTDWQIFANNCHLIYNICVSLIIGARLNWLPTGCIVVIFLYNSNVAEHLWHFTVKSPSCMNYIRIEFFKADWIVSSCRLIADWISLVGVFLSPQCTKDCKCLLMLFPSS